MALIFFCVLYEHRYSARLCVCVIDVFDIWLLVLVCMSCGIKSLDRQQQCYRLWFWHRESFRWNDFRKKTKGRFERKLMEAFLMEFLLSLCVVYVSCLFCSTSLERIPMRMDIPLAITDPHAHELFLILEFRLSSRWPAEICPLKWLHSIREEKKNCSDIFECSWASTIKS